MSLVPQNNPGRHYLMERLRGVTRGEWALFVLATPVYFFAADVFHRRSIKELHSLWKRGSPVPILRRFYRFGSMDMLMSFGTTIAYFSSIVELIIAATLPDTVNMERNTTYFDSVVFLTMFLLIGRLIEAYSKAKTGEAVTMLGKLRPKEALLVLPNNGKEGGDGIQNVPIDMLDYGDMVRIVHGGSPPWDGTLLEGSGEFDESSLTGESKLVKKAVGDPVYSGTVNKGGPILMRTTGVSGDSLLDQIISVVREGQARRAPIERVADLLTSYFVPVVTLVAISTWLIWLILGVTGALPREYLDVATICNVLKELEGNSSHPIGKAVGGFCESKMSTGAKAREVEEIAGKGMKGSFDVETLPYPLEVLAGNEALMVDHGIAPSNDASATLHSWKAQAKSVVLVAARAMPTSGHSSWRLVAIFAASDPLRPESRPVVETLRRRGVEVWMISGDNPTTANAVGAMVGIPAEHIIAGVLPEQKADKVMYLQRSQAKPSPSSILGFGARRTKERAVVAMVGDGVNDSPALTVADVGIAIGSGSDVAISAAEFVLIKSDLTTLLTLITLSRTVFRRVKFNFGWALVYNLIALPIAAGVLYPVISNGQHVRLDPVWASLAMALSSGGQAPAGDLAAEAE
ncbi:hypothetical protein Purlil1_12414 [Purpureocillium lilacinum]|uniref:P-type ATPase A domain-containing protein n=1 Tax=Purpureocillium lilacinum TaxID=33203 RepID=A0ABR0BGY5_PURLI|nr:hypothetical protein Purlil1_12414 [Purpureocillium lilacinum]